MRYRYHILLIVIFFTTGFFYSFVRWLKTDLPLIEALERYEHSTVSKVYDINDNVVYEFYEEKRFPVPLKKVPPCFVDAFISMEDRRFRKHWGVNVYAVARAAFVNLRAKRIVLGASTITQQLARNLFLTREKSIIRKLKEAILAVEIERVYSKDEILEMYLNQIYFGNGVYGIEAASGLYFGKKISDLKLEEIATLVSIPKSPLIYSPYNNPDLAKKRRNLVLDVMASCGVISTDEDEFAKSEPMIIQPKALRPNEAPYFIEEVRKELETRFGSEFLYRGGISIYTTLDLDLQRIANRVVEEGIEKLEERFRLDVKKENFVLDTLMEAIPYLQGALVALDVSSGYLKALVGGRDFVHSQFNRAIQAQRQAGSSFKPFVFTAAIDNGFTPSYQILDAPIVVEVSDTIWRPTNYDEKFKGLMSLRRGLALSRNLVAIRLIRSVGVHTVAEYAKRMGIESQLLDVYSLALGSCEVNLLELVNGYETIANYGVKVRPTMILRVVDKDGKIIYQSETMREKVLSPQIAYIMTNMMESVFNYGTAWSARANGFTRPAAGKTGTTNDFTDAWFIGYIPSLICGVWVGFDERKEIAEHAVGAKVALPIWTEFMKETLEDKPVEHFVVPPGIVKRKICKQTGLLATESCPKVTEEIFIAGTQPIDSCSFHRLRLDDIKKGDRIFEEIDKEILKKEEI